VAHAVFLQRVGLAAHVPAHEIVAPAAFVDVVAEEDHQIRRIAQQLRVAVEIALLVVLARGERELERARRGVQRWRRAAAAGPAQRRTGHEAIEIGAIRTQPGDVDMHAVGELVHCAHAAFGHYLAEGFVLGDLPLHADHRVALDAAVGLQRRGRQPCPQAETVRRRIARGHAELEGIGDEARRLLGACERRAEQSDQAEPGSGRQQFAATQAARAQQGIETSGAIRMRHGWACKWSRNR
jgi:hypothetical protein